MSAHTINRQIFEFTCRSEGIATSVQKEILHYTSSEMTRIIDDVLTSGMVQPGHYTINKLEIDLGDILVQDFGKSEMLHHFSKLLKDKVHSFMNEQATYEREDTSTETDPDLTITRAFLLHGDVPWWADKSSPIDIDAVLEKLLRRKPEAIKELLAHRSGSVPVLQRLLTQYKPYTLSLVKALLPGTIDEFYSNGIVSAAGYQINHSQLYKRLLKHKSAKGKIISEEYKSKRLLKLLKTPFQGWAGSLKHLQVLSADEFADVEALLHSRIRVDSRTLLIPMPISKKLSLYHIEFLLQQAAVFKASKDHEKKDTAETPATIKHGSNPPWASPSLTPESTAGDAAINEADDSLVPNESFAKAGDENKFPERQASGQLSVRAGNKITNTAISASQSPLFADGKENRPPISGPVPPVASTANATEPPDAYASAPLASTAEQARESLENHPIDSPRFSTEQVKEATSSHPMPDSRFSKEQAKEATNNHPMPDSRFSTEQVKESTDSHSGIDSRFSKEQAKEATDSHSMPDSRFSKEQAKEATDSHSMPDSRFSKEQAKEATDSHSGIDSRFSKEQIGESVDDHPVGNPLSSTDPAKPPVVDHSVDPPRFSGEHTQEPAEPDLPSQRSPLADQPNRHSPVNKDTDLVREIAEQDTSRTEPTTKLFRADLRKDAQALNREGETENNDLLQKEDIDKSREPSFVKQTNLDGTEVHTPVRASDAQLRKYISSILKKLPKGNPALHNELSAFSDRDLFALQKRFTQLDKGTDRLKIVESTLKHPYLFRYAWLETFVKPSYQEGRPAEESVNQAMDIKGKNSHTDALVKSMRSAQAGIQQAIRGLSSTDAVILKNVLEKKRIETASERRILKKVLQGLPDETLGLLHFFTQLSEEEMGEIFYEADATGDFPKAEGSNAVNGPVYFPEQQSRRILVENAGLCLIAPYLPTLFNRLGYLDNKVFKSSRFAHKALYLLQYMVTGKRKDREFVLQFNKLLCGFEVEDSILPDVRFQKSELTEADNVLESVIAHWRMLKNTSVNGFRGSFLLRKGILLEGELHWTLQVERKEYDLLLNSLPWGFSLIKLPWMKKHIQVEW